jgi:hypothetical protein
MAITSWTASFNAEIPSAGRTRQMAYAALLRFRRTPGADQGASLCQGIPKHKTATAQGALLRLLPGAGARRNGPSAALISPGGAAGAVPRAAPRDRLRSAPRSPGCSPSCAAFKPGADPAGAETNQVQIERAHADADEGRQAAGRSDKKGSSRGDRRGRNPMPAMGSAAWMRPFSARRTSASPGVLAPVLRATSPAQGSPSSWWWPIAQCVSGHGAVFQRAVPCPLPPRQFGLCPP